ncbi:MAG: phosphotransferase [Chloroflexota bacterium]
MLEPPADLSNETLVACLQDRYALTISAIEHLPLGHDSAAWVYRVEARDGAAYFLKLRLRVTNEAGLLVPRYLQDHGVRHVVAPLLTVDGVLWTRAGAYAVLLYPFVEGRTGMRQGMTDAQWVEYGRLLRQIHETVVRPAVTPELAWRLGRDTFRPDGADQVQRLDAEIGERTYADPLHAELARSWCSRRAQIRTVHERARQLGSQLAALRPPLVLCHADIHTNNVLVDPTGQLWIADWDETILAPRERDLMFAIGGISSRHVTPHQEVLFLEGYGPVEVNPLALAYYRCAWAVSDIGAYGEQVMARPDLGPATRQECVERFESLFEPGSIVDIALGSVIPDA